MPITIRQTFDPYANPRPVRTIGGLKGPLGYVDMLFVRENTEGGGRNSMSAMIPQLQ